MRELFALAITLAIEVPICAALLGKRVTGPAIGANVVTQPLLAYVGLPVLGSLLGPTAGLLTAEAIVTLVESATFVVFGEQVAPSIAVAALANASSVVVGLLIWRTLGWW